jgi:simple sugar transport system ATP-binding protein
LLNIGMVFQSFNLIPAFSVAENIALFFPELKGVFDIQRVASRIKELSSLYELSINPMTPVKDLSVGDQQKVEILKLLVSDAQILILDEPTRVLAPHEIEALFKILDNLRRDGYAIVLITHKLREVMQVADRVAVLRKGRLIASLPIQEVDEKQLVTLMFDRKVSEFKGISHTEGYREMIPMLKLDEISTQAEGAEVDLKVIDLEIASGEIVGITGVSGNGQRELADVVLGRLKVAEGKVFLDGEDVTHSSIRDIRRKGVAFIPEDPLKMAVAPFLTVLENFVVPNSNRYARAAGLQMSWESASKDYSRSMDDLDFKFPLYAPARSLSGGNLQRMVIAREFAHDPKLIIASYLTSGLDVRSAIAAREALVKARDRGAGILFFSDDLDELFSISDRLIVLRSGQITGSFSPAETNYHEIGYLMTGSEEENVHTS